MRIGVTGHSDLAPESIPLIADALRELLHGYRNGLVGLSCLARGADQVFARAVVDLGARLHVVLPAPDYRERKVAPDDRAEFDALLDSAHEVRVLRFAASGTDAYVAASEAVLEQSDALVAVWDGHPARGRGGTGDVVEEARRRAIPVTVVWPTGAARTG
jgi:hypothetical protein